MRAWAAVALALFVAACDDVTDAEKTGLVDAIRTHTLELNLSARSGGFYTLVPDDPVRYVNLAHNPIGERKHGVSIWIIQNDQNRPGSSVLTESKQILINEPAFFRDKLCPPADLVAAHKDDFEIYINLFSRKFDLNVKVPCE